MECSLYVYAFICYLNNNNNTCNKHNLTSQALIARSNPPKRPFVLSRSYYAGSQRFGAIWTGDNLGTWEHMAVSIPMVLSNSIAGMTFVGGMSSLLALALVQITFV
jgi:alpha 1,3-glucosidase